MPLMDDGYRCKSSKPNRNVHKKKKNPKHNSRENHKYDNYYREYQDDHHFHWLQHEEHSWR